MGDRDGSDCKDHFHPGPFNGVNRATRRDKNRGLSPHGRISVIVINGEVERIPFKTTTTPPWHRKSQSRRRSKIQKASRRKNRG